MFHGGWKKCLQIPYKLPGFINMCCQDEKEGVKCMLLPNCGQSIFCSFNSFDGTALGVDVHAIQSETEEWESGRDQSIDL